MKESSIMPIDATDDPEPLSGFDMSPTIAWYSRHCEGLLKRLPPPGTKPLMIPIENPEHLMLDAYFLGALYRLFPTPIMSLFSISRIVGKPCTWFHYSTTGENPQLTENRREALSATALVPALYDSEEESFMGSIWLYKISSDSCPPDVAKIILAEAFVHELSHNLFNHLLHGNLRVEMPGGNSLEGKEYITEFTEITEGRPPISHYSSAYRDKEDRYLTGSKWGLHVPISEEFAETVTAYLLGFTHCRDDRRGLYPFEDRPETEELIRKLFVSAITGGRCP